MELFDVVAFRLAGEVIFAGAGGRPQFLAAGILLLIAARFAVAGLTPLSYDEAYYWLWSKHLAAGYYDHPPAIAFLIRAGTGLFGDTSIGVRAFPVFLSALATLALWRAGAILLETELAGGLTALLFNLMPMIGLQTLTATPDAPEIAAASFLLYALAKISETGRGQWWIAAGVAVGFALLSKYTALFLGAGIFAWLAFVARERRWFLSFWPYLGGAVALAMFAPVIVWNAEHGWISFATQFGRVAAGGFTLRFLGEFIAGQFGLASPFIAILGVAGAIAIVRSPQARTARPALILAIAVPALLYFTVHSLHDRVQGNWPSFIYPAFAVAAAAGFANAPVATGRSFLLRLSRLLALPVSLTMILAIYAQALFAIVPLREPVTRLLAVGMDRVVASIETMRAREGAGTILTTSYALTGWLAFYLPSHPPVIQLNERFRWLNEPEPPAEVFEGPMLYITEIRNDQAALLAARFVEVTLLARIARHARGPNIDEYAVYRVEGLRGAPLYQGR